MSNNTQGRLVLPDLLKRLAPFFASLEVPIYLVGGTVRDAVLGRSSNDLDFVVPTDGIRIAYRMGDFLGMPAYTLDKERDVGRVVLKENKTYIDVATFRGETIIEDLVDRDYTLNSLGIPANGSTIADILDPTDGLKDIDNRLVRMVHGGSLTQDPLRMLRGVRMGLKFDFQIETETAAAIQQNAAQINACSKERVRDELLNILRVNAGDGIRALKQLGLFQHTVPVIDSPKSEDNTLQLAQFMDLVTDPLPAALPLYEAEYRLHFQRNISGGLSGSDLFIVASLFFPEGFRHKRWGTKGFHKELDQALRRLKFSSAAITGVQQTLDGGKRFESLLTSERIDTRERHRFWRGCGQLGLDTVLQWVLWAQIKDGQSESDQINNTANNLLEHYVKYVSPTAKQPPLLSGHDLMHQLQLKPGPHIGELLDQIEEERVVGHVSTVEEAIDFAEQILHARD